MLLQSNGHIKLTDFDLSYMGGTIAPKITFNASIFKRKVKVNPPTPPPPPTPPSSPGGSSSDSQHAHRYARPALRPGHGRQGRAATCACTGPGMAAS